MLLQFLQCLRGVFAVFLRLFAFALQKKGTNTAWPAFTLHGRQAEERQAYEVQDRPFPAITCYLHVLHSLINALHLCVQEIANTEARTPNMRPPLRLNLRELDGPFERFCAMHGHSCADVLRTVAARLCADSALALQAAPASRRQRDVHFPTPLERDRAEQRAADLGLSLSAAVRQSLLAHMLEQLLQARVLAVPAPGAPLLKRAFAVQAGRLMAGHKQRLEIQFTQNEKTVLTELAGEYGFDNVQDLLVSVTRAFVSKMPVLSKADRAFIGQTNLSMVRIGANINQIARAVNQLKDIDAAQLDRLANAAEAIKAQSKQISDLIVLLSKRWELQMEGRADEQNN